MFRLSVLEVRLLLLDAGEVATRVPVLVPVEVLALRLGEELRVVPAECYPILTVYLIIDSYYSFFDYCENNLPAVVPGGVLVALAGVVGLGVLVL